MRTKPVPRVIQALVGVNYDDHRPIEATTQNEAMEVLYEKSAGCAIFCAKTYLTRGGLERVKLMVCTTAAQIANFYKPRKTGWAPCPLSASQRREMLPGGVFTSM